MPRYQVQWTRECEEYEGYFKSGLVDIEADNEEEAHAKVLEEIKYYSGYLHYDQYNTDSTNISILKKIL